MSFKMTILYFVVAIAALYANISSVIIYTIIVCSCIDSCVCAVVADVIVAFAAVNSNFFCFTFVGVVAEAIVSLAAYH